MKNIKESDREHSEHVNPKNPVNDHVCSVIRRVRIQKGLRVQEMARLSGIPLGSYSCLETGRYRLSLENLYRILWVLKLNPSDVLPPPDRNVRPDNRVTEEVVLESLERAKRRQPPLLTIEDVVDAVCLAYGMDREEISSPSRVRKLSQARSVATQLVRGLPHLTLSDLSRELKRDVSSLSHCLRRLKQSPPDRRSEYSWQLEKARKLLAKRLSRKTAQARMKRKK